MRLYLGAIALGAMLCAPLSMVAQERTRETTTTTTTQRYYDREHKTYHDWNDGEQKAWEHWVKEERHGNSHEFAKAKKQEQRDYWRWRHDHSDWHE